MEALVRIAVDRLALLILPIAIAAMVTLVPVASFLMLGALATYVILRWSDAGAGLGYETLAQIDRLFVGGLLVAQGFFAFFCSGIGPTGFLSTGFLTGLFFRAHGQERLGAPARIALAFVWAMVFYRFARPLTPWWCCRLMNNIG